ncbi:energy transducer TonB [Novosphingobium sp. BL-52-GroH]|uniref:energy transducer TonB n=1 Tax=Novosphingobium sp. BL-52-GroH TaxID=3349877 RepID=UPI00384FADF9
MMMDILLMAAVASATAAEPIGDPGTWITSADYPSSEVQTGSAGATETVLLIDEKGEVKDCRVRLSSGSATLDATGCALLKVRGKFRPARDGTGARVATYKEQRIVWRRSPDADFRLPGVPSVVSVAVDVDVDGVIQGCTLLEGPRASGPASDPCVPYPQGRKARPATDADGKPIAYRLIQTMSMKFEPRP